MAKQAYQLGRDARKIDPKLRMIANGDLDVNVVRAEQCAAIAVSSAATVSRRPYSSVVLAREPHRALPARGNVTAPTAGILANVFVTTESPAPLSVPGFVETARLGNLATATIPLADLKKLASQPEVRSVSLGQPLRTPDPVIDSAFVAEPKDGLRAVPASDLHRFGDGVLVGIVDVQGFDFAHPDFLDAKGRTRFEAIWDQGAAVAGSGSPFGYGRVLTKSQMDAAIAGAAKAGAPAVELEPQSRMQPQSHGTHVASIAAGNKGIARRSRIAAVLVSLGPQDSDRRLSFYDSTRLAHAVDYLLDLGRRLNLPVAINISLGTNGHAHDDSAPLNRWIDAQLATSGRCICVAAGNAGQEKAASAGDYGFVMGRIHTSGQLPAAGLDADIEWTVAGRGGRDYSGNELEFWFSAQDRIAVSLRTPTGDWIGPVAPLEFIENRRLPDGTFVSLYNELYHAANGCNYIGVYLSPNLKASPIVGVRAGLWTVRLHAREIRDGRYHGWIERDDPYELPAPPGQPTPLAYPSFFTERSNVDDSSVSTLACGRRVVSVANLDEAREAVNISSSQGPTRDGRHKPEVCAPGTDIVAACGFSGRQQRWVSMTGTSMASPYVCGVTALMLAAKPTLTAAQVGGIIQRTARPLPGADFRWHNDAGFGRIDPEACVREARAINDRVDRT